MSKRKPKAYRCFFCDEVFRTRKAAWYHFGESGCDTDVPACIDPLRTDEKERLKELRDAQAYAMQCQDEASKAEDDASMYHQYQDELERMFGKGVRTPHQAWLRFEAAQNEAKDGRKSKDLIKSFAVAHAETYAELRVSQSMDIPVEFLALCEFAEEMGVKLP